MSDGTRRDTAKDVSMFRLNPDGSYETAYSFKPDIYISDTQAAALWNTKIAKHIREVYGPIVCVMHEKVLQCQAPACETFKYILGA